MSGLTLVRTRALGTLHLDHLPQVLLPLFDPRLPLALPAGGGGARVATLAFCAHLWSSDQDGPGPLCCSGLDLSLDCSAFASLIFSTIISTEVPKSLECETGALKRKPFSFFPISARFTHRCLSITTMAAIDLPMAVAACLVARRAKSVVRRSSLPRQVTSPDPYPGLSADQPGTH